MASWRDQLRKVTLGGRALIGASFRGVPFLVDSSEFAGGRRGARHEFPLRDTPYVEDIGRKGRSFPVEGYVLGDDYLAQRDALISALEQAGPGELVHPSYGSRRVAVGEFRVRESTAEGGIARFGITFDETEVAPEFPSSSAAGTDLVEASADAARAAAATDFLAGYDVEGLPVGALESLASSIEGAAEAIVVALGPVVTATQQLAALKSAADDLALDALGLARQPGLIVGGLLRTIETLIDPPLRSGLWLPAVLKAYDFIPDVGRPSAVTELRRREAESYDAIMRLVRTQLAVFAARAAVGDAYDSYDAAVAARDSICDRLDEQMESTPDASFAALTQLRADLVRGLPGEGSDLPRLRTFVLEQVVPSLVLAYRLYGDLSLESDIVARNRIVRPGFVPGGRPIEVLGADA